MHDADQAVGGAAADEVQDFAKGFKEPLGAVEPQGAELVELGVGDGLEGEGFSTPDGWHGSLVGEDKVQRSNPAVTPAAKPPPQSQARRQAGLLPSFMSIDLARFG